MLINIIKNYFIHKFGLWFSPAQKRGNVGLIIRIIASQSRDCGNESLLKGTF
jgi:hypothetical protein